MRIFDDIDRTSGHMLSFFVNITLRHVSPYLTWLASKQSWSICVKLAIEVNYCHRNERVMVCLVLLNRHRS